MLSFMHQFRGDSFSRFADEINALYADGMFEEHPTTDLLPFESWRISFSSSTLTLSLSLPALAPRCFLAYVSAPYAWSSAIWSAVSSWWELQEVLSIAQILIPEFVLKLMREATDENIDRDYHQQHPHGQRCDGLAKWPVGG